MDQSPVTEHLDRVGEQLRAGRGALLRAVDMRLDELRRSRTDVAPPSPGEGWGEVAGASGGPLEPPLPAPVALAPVSPATAGTNGSAAPATPQPAPSAAPQPDPAATPQPAPAPTAQPAPSATPQASPAPTQPAPQAAPAAPTSVPPPPGAPDQRRPAWVSNVIAALLALAVLMIALGVLSLY